MELPYENHLDQPKVFQHQHEAVVEHAQQCGSVPRTSDATKADAASIGTYAKLRISIYWP